MPSALAGHVLDQSVCAVGDLHGDLDHAIRALRLCGVVDVAGNWIGGNATVVQSEQRVRTHARTRAHMHV